MPVISTHTRSSTAYPCVTHLEFSSTLSMSICLCSLAMITRRYMIDARFNIMSLPGKVWYGVESIER